MKLLGYIIIGVGVRDVMGPLGKCYDHSEKFGNGNCDISILIC